MVESEYQVVDHVVARHGEAPLYAQATTGADGGFVLEGLPEGTFMLWALGERGAKRQQDVAAGAEGVELVLDSGLTVQGVVTDEEGSPLPEVRLTFLHEGHTRFFDTRSGADGEYRMGPLPKDRYALVAEKEGWLPRFVPGAFLESQAEVVLYRPIRLPGRVLLAAAPAPGLEVRLVSLDSPEFEPRVAVADAEGRFAFEALGPGEYRLTASSGEQHAIEDVELEGARRAPKEVELNLGEARYVEGTVQDGSRRPVGGASITVRPRDEYVREWTAVTDAEGHYRLGPVEPGAYTFDLSAPRYVDVEDEPRRLEADTGRVDFTLRSAATVTGVVVDEEGQPVSQLRLELSRPVAPEDEDEMSSPMAWSDEEGRFAIDASVAGEWTLGVADERFISKSVRVQAPAENLRVVLTRGATVVGTVSDASGEPIGGAWLTLWAADKSALSTRSELTNVEGRATLRGLLPGSYVVQALQDYRGVERRASAKVELRGSEQHEVALSFEAGWTLSGTVVDGEGQPIEGVAVRAEHLLGEMPTWRSKRRRCGNAETNDVRTGPDGRFRVKHLVGETFEVVAFKRGFTFNVARSAGGERLENSVLRVREGAEVRLVMDRSARIRGRVVGPEGKPLRRFTVNGLAVNDAAGAFELPFEETGTELLEFEAPWKAPVLRRVQVRAGVDVDLGEVRLDEGRRITGRVVDAETGAPVVDAAVQPTETVHPDSGVPHEWGNQSVTDEDGTFELEQVEARALTLVVRHDGYMEARVPLGAGEETVPVSLVPGARVEATLNDEQGRALQGEIHLRQEGGLNRETIPVQGGTGQRRGIEPGVYLARAIMREMGGEGGLHAQRVRIPERGVVKLSFTRRSQGATLKVRLEDREYPADAFVLPAGLSLPITSSALGQWRFSAVRVEKVEPDGALLFPYLPPGRATLLILEPVPYGGFHVEELELPESGVVERLIRPTWKPLPPK
jgi:protocatechuate 3,4-dioxygenase beta subunit